MEKNIINGPTGETLLDLPSPYQADQPTGLLHFPRFIAKIRKHLAGELPKSYQRNFTKGFDGFLCLHLGVEPEDVIECVKNSNSCDEAKLSPVTLISPPAFGLSGIILKKEFSKMLFFCSPPYHLIQFL